MIELAANDANPKTADTYLFDMGKIRVFHSGDSLFLDKFAEIDNRYGIDID